MDKFSIRLIYMGLGALAIIAIALLGFGIVKALVYTLQDANGNPVMLFDFTFPDAIKERLLTFDNCVMKVEEGQYDSKDGTVIGTMVTFYPDCPILDKLPRAVRKLDMGSNTCYFNYMNSSTINSTNPFAKCGSINGKWTCQVVSASECLQ